MHNCLFQSNLLPRIAIPLLSSLALLASGLHGAKAADATSTVSYVLPKDEGYGLSDCLASNTQCARVVADAWCEAHGNGKSVFVGDAADITGAIAIVGKQAPVSSSKAIVVTCSE